MSVEASPQTASVSSPRRNDSLDDLDADDSSLGGDTRRTISVAPSPKSLASSRHSAARAAALPPSQTAGSSPAPRDSPGVLHPHVYRTAPLPHQDPTTFSDRRDQVLHRRLDQHSEFVNHIQNKWKMEEEARLARERAALDAKPDDDLVLSRLEAWSAPLLLAMHFTNAFAAAAEEIRATNNLRFFLLPLCVLYARRMRKKLRLRHALAAETAKGSTKLDRPTATTLKLSSPMLARWPEASLQALADGMKPRMYEEGDAIFLRGEFARTSYVHLLVRGLITVPDATESHESSNGHSEVMLFDSRRAKTDAAFMHSITSGTLLGEFGAFVGEKFRHTYMCRCDCIVYSIESQAFLALVNHLPPSVFTFVSTLAKNRFKRRVLNERPTPDMVRNSHPFFASWPNDPISSLLEAGSPAVFRVQERIFRDSRTTNRLFFVISGTITIDKRHGDKTTARHGVTIGSESIVPVVLPHLGGELSAVADTFVETWSFPRPETMNIMHRFNLTDHALDECARVVYNQLPPLSADTIRKANVFNFLPDKSAARLAELFKPVVLLPDTILVRQDAVVTDVIIVVWGTVQLFTTESRTRERKVVGELHPGVTFGAAEVVAQAVANVSVIATNATIVATVSKAAVYAAIELGGKNLLVAVLDRANQLVGSRSAEARARLEEEVRAARDAMERDANPQQQIDDAIARCAKRIQEVRQAQREAAEAVQSKEALEHKAIIARLTADARRARELQKLTVEHRVFACIKSQVYGGARHEHTELVHNYYATPFDRDEPVFIEDVDSELGSPEAKLSAADRIVHHPVTGSVAVTVPVSGDITFVDQTATSPTERSPHSASPGWAADDVKSGLTFSDEVRAVTPSNRAAKRVSPLMEQPSTMAGRSPSLTGSVESRLVVAFAPAPPPPLMRKEALKEAIRDPLPDLRAPPPPKPVAVVTQLNAQQHERANALKLVEQRAREKREREAREYAALFSTEPLINPREAATTAPAPGTTLPPLLGQAPRQQPIPQASRMQRESPRRRASPRRRLSPSGDHDAAAPPPSSTARGPRGAATVVRHTTQLHPSVAYPDMRITVDPNKMGRSVGAQATSWTAVAKGRPEGRVFAQTARLPLPPM